NLPDTWEDFKTQIVDLCTEQALESLQRYNNEPWSSYVNRLKEKAVSSKTSGEEVFKKLRRENLPEIFIKLFYSFGVSLDNVAERIKEFEDNAKASNDKYQKNERSYDKKLTVQKDLSKITCYNCNKEGHYATDCTEKNISGSINSLNKDFSPYSLDTDKVKINDLSLIAVFDSGACESVITSKLLKRLGNVRCSPTKKEFRVIDGSVVIVNYIVDLWVDYNDKKIMVTFNVINNEKDETLLLSNTCSKFLRSKRKIPIECCIDTKDHAPISWSRPIKSLRDKRDFENLVDDLEERGIIEKSTSPWLNPTVLVRKKNGSLRFCVDFRRLNDIVDLDGFEIPKIQELITL
ncbi:Transposon Ty3-I Gag-Pol polyprotein, partial [Nosema granulosis]